MEEIFSLVEGNSLMKLVKGTFHMVMVEDFPTQGGPHTLGGGFPLTHSQMIKYKHIYRQLQPT